jgi:hypothetical protein
MALKEVGRATEGGRIVKTPTIGAVTIGYMVGDAAT